LATDEKSGIRPSTKEGVDQSVVIVEFETLAKAIAAYDSELYGPALKVFDNAAERDFRIVEGR